LVKNVGFVVCYFWDFDVIKDVVTFLVPKVVPIDHILPALLILLAAARTLGNH
jgi:hypothetical protein